MDDLLGRRIRILRKRRELTQQELSYRTGISAPHISSIERGMRHPSLEYAVRIAEALGVNVDYFANLGETTSLPDETGYRKPTDLPAYLQSFILNETSQPYIAMAHRVSRLDQSDYTMLCALIDMMAQRKHLKKLSLEDN